MTNIERRDEPVEDRAGLPAPAEREASRTARGALAVLALTSVHHAYGAHVYQTPWRYHVLLLSVPAALVILVARLRLRAQPGGAFAPWVFALTTLVVPVAGIGAFEGFYNHAVKDALTFAGAPRAVLETLFPPTRYVPPSDAFFEITGVLQAVVAALVARDLYRFVSLRASKRGDAAREASVVPAVGAVAPDFALLDANGDRRRLSELCARGPLVLVFYRGHWCPFCLRQLAQHRDRLLELTSLGAGVAALSVDTPERSRTLAARLDLPFPLLCDPGREVVAGWGLLNRGEKGGIAYPATFVLDGDLTIRFRSLDRTVSRVDLDGLFEFLRDRVEGAAPPVPRRSAIAPRPGDLLNATANVLRHGLRSPDKSKA